MITVNEIPDFDIEGAESACSGTEYPYQITTTQTNLIYSWIIDGVTIPNSNVSVYNQTWTNAANASNQTHTISVTATTPEGCSVTKEKDVDVLLIDFDLTGDLEVCTGGDATYLISPIQPNVSYEWKVDGVTVSPSPLSSYDHNWINTSSVSQFHTVSVTAASNNGSNCSVTKELSVEVFVSPPVITVSPDIVVCRGNQTNISLFANSANYSNYSWTSSPNVLIINPNQSNINIDVNQLQNGITSFTVIGSNGTCTNSATVQVTVVEEVNLILPANICQNQTLALTGGVPAGGIYSNPQGAISFNGTNYIFDPSGLQAGFSYPITYTTIQGCVGTATAEIEVKNSRKDYNLQITACAGSLQAEVFLTPSLSNGDELTILGQTYTSGTSWSFSGYSIGTQILASIYNPNSGSCSEIYINGTLNTTTVSVSEKAAKDLYVKDNASDFGIQPSTGGSASPSVAWSLLPPPVDLSISINDPYEANPNTNVNENTWFYYQDANPEYNVVVNHPKGGSIVMNNDNYLYITVYNGGCEAFGKGLGVDAYFYHSNTGQTGSIWRPLIPADANDDNLNIPGGVIRIPEDIPAGKSLIIMKKVSGGLIPTTQAHTCTMPRILPCASDAVYNDNCNEETLGQGLPAVDLPASFVGYPITYNNVAWRNVNLVYPSNSQGRVLISNTTNIDRIVRINLDFQNHIFTHYLENNELELVLSPTLYNRWMQAGQVTNNLIYSGGFFKFKAQEERDAWIDFYLSAGESHELGINFNILPPNNSQVVQDPIYYLELIQYNDGERAGSVNYEILVNGDPITPTAPTTLSASSISFESIQLDWANTPTNGDVLVLERRKMLAPVTDYEIIANVSPTTTSYVDTGLDYYTTYQYRLKAVANTSLSSGYVYSLATRTLDIIPATPIDLEAVLNSDGTVNINWNDQAVYERGYEISRSIDGGAYVMLDNNLTIDTERYHDTQIATDGSYRYRVRAFSHQNYSSYATSIALSISKPQTPSLNATLHTNTNPVKIELSWNPIINATGYRIERSENGGAYQIISLSNPISHEDFNISDGNIYSYRLYALQGNLESDPDIQAITVNIGYTISGTIKNHSDNVPVKTVIVELLDGNENFISNVTTLLDGNYSFDVDPNNTYTIRPSKDSNPHNGVDNADLSALNNVSGNPYLYIAADVNNDCIVNQADFNMAYAFVHYNVNMTASSWKFVSSDYNMNLVYNSTVNQSPCFDNSRTYISVNSNHIDQDFIGIKTGDLTDSAVPSQKVSTQIEVEKVNLTASPNPFNTSTTIRFSSKIADEKYTMVVRNSLGQEIKRIEGVTKKGNNKVEINMLGYASGLYYVEYISSDRRENIKIVLAK